MQFVFKLQLMTRLSLLLNSLGCMRFFQVTGFYFRAVYQIFMESVDLSRLCDSCGRSIGGGYGFCYKCKIYLCFSCHLQLMEHLKVYPVVCPMCKGKIWSGSERKELEEEINRNHREGKGRERG